MDYPFSTVPDVSELLIRLRLPKVYSLFKEHYRGVQNHNVMYIQQLADYSGALNGQILNYLLLEIQHQVLPWRQQRVMQLAQEGMLKMRSEGRRLAHQTMQGVITVAVLIDRMDKSDKRDDDATGKRRVLIYDSELEKKYYTSISNNLARRLIKSIYHLDPMDPSIHRIYEALTIINDQYTGHEVHANAVALIGRSVSEEDQAEAILLAEQLQPTDLSVKVRENVNKRLTDLLRDSSKSLWFLKAAEMHGGYQVSEGYERDSLVSMLDKRSGPEFDEYYANPEAFPEWPPFEIPDINGVLVVGVLHVLSPTDLVATAQLEAQLEAEGLGVGVGIWH